jgi:hypothetical protein
MTADALASALMLARKEEEYEAARVAYYKGKGKDTNLAELAAEFDAMRTAHLEAFGPSAGGDGDAVVIPLPVDSSAGVKGLGE